MSAALPATTVSIPPQLAANIESWGVTHARFVSDGVSTYIKPTHGHRGMNRHRTFKLYLTWSMADPISIRPGVQQILWQRSSSSPNTRIVESPPDLNYPSTGRV
ncbi:uncharacterized protein QC763_203940 [Podospora pseudopauciseta]|uniref:Uncharacterized protein n=1 Tax=Podospora pseudopauciseta TaxID=2093780 RepID=A0ABR0HN76_9PEZI|nr:hypothetical protein QC763_203940 [Podospora pseudopauciseta]